MNKVTKRLLIVSAQILTLCCFTFAQGVPATAPLPNPNLTAPGPRAQQPAGGQRPPATNLGIVKPPTSPLVSMAGQGVIVGYVYWDTKSVTHTPPATSCSGLGAVVSVGTPPKGQGFEQFKLLGTYHNFTYITNLGSMLVCEYVVKQVPVGQDLQVMVNFKQPSFTPAVTAAVPPTANNPNRPINISGGSCNKMPPAVPTASVLGSAWWTCGNNAYNVNFVLQPATAANMGTGHGQITLLPGNLQHATPSGSQGGMLAGGNAPRGMLSGGTNAGPQQSLGGSLKGGVNPGPIGTPTSGVLPGGVNPGPINTPNGGALAAGRGPGPMQTPPNTQSGTAGQLLPAKPAGGGTVQLNPQPYPPKGTTSSLGSNANTVQLNPQPYPPKGTSSVMGNKQLTPTGQGSAAGKVALKPVRLPAPTALRKVTNPSLAQQNASIMAVLDQQRLAAQQDSAAMRSAAPSAATTRTTVATNFQRSLPASGLGPSQTQSAPGNSISSLAHLQPFNSVVLVCSMDTTPRILRVNGGQAPGIFTPEAKYNQYTIVGCSFGQSQGSAHIFGPNGFSANLNIDYWSNNGITAHLDPSLAGVLDQNNVTLVVVPPGQQQIQKSNYKFYAARGMPLPDGTDQEVQLAYDSMPQSNVTLYNGNPVLAGYERVPQNGSSKFPSFSFQGTPVAGWVFRYAYGHSDANNQFNLNPQNWSCFINDVGYSQTSTANPCATYFDRWQTFGADTWDFSKLSSGFTISSYELYYEDIDAQTQLCCSWDATNHACNVPGSWDFNLIGSGQITVAWPVYWCWDTEATPFDRLNQQEQSAYGLAVWVLGPRCIDAWTGQRNQSCMAKVKQILG